MMEKSDLYSLTKADIELSAEGIEEIKYLQENNNELLDAYLRHCISLLKILFDIGNSMNRSDSKNEVFELTKMTFELYSILDKLKKPSG